MIRLLNTMPNILKVFVKSWGTIMDLPQWLDLLYGKAYNFIVFVQQILKLDNASPFKNN